MRVRVTMTIALAVLLAGCGDDGGVIAPTTEAPTTTVASTTTTTVPGPGLAWARISHDEAVFGGADRQAMRSVTVGGPGLVAAGSDSAGGDDDAAVWTSPDGVTWARIAHDEAVFGGDGNQEIISVTAGGPGLVAAGSDGVADDNDAAVWTSPDGVTWTRIPHDEAVFGGAGNQVMRSVTVGGPGLVAAGSDSAGGDDDAAVWTSPDGVTWTRVPHDEAVFGGDDNQAIRSLTLGGPGLVAVGAESPTGQVIEAESDAAVWASPDGYAWTRIPHDEAVFGGGSMISVTAGGPGLVAAGSEAMVHAAVWVSPDGYTWTRIDDEADFGGPSQELGTSQRVIYSVTAGGPGVVAVGYDAGSDGDGAVWTSIDGYTWARVDDAAEFGTTDFQVILSVITGGPGLVAVGDDDSGGSDPDAAVWVSPPPTIENGAASPVTDPLPSVDQPGAVTCSGCPEIEGITDFVPDVAEATTLTLTGIVAGADGNGVFFVDDGRGHSVGGHVPNDGGGFEVTVPLFCGEQSVKLAWQNEAGTSGVVVHPVSSACTTAAIQVTLTWDALGDDFELHLIREGGRINDRTDDESLSNDCTWNTCIHSSPNWGAIESPDDDPTKDIDDMGSYGPENITLRQPESITYTVMVEHWGRGSDKADGAVTINVENGDTLTVPITNLAPHWVVTVATIEFPSGTITPIGERYDCNEEWGFNGGCGAALPG